MTVPVGVVVFGRMDSRRLPGKMLRRIAGRTLLNHVIDRARGIPGNLPLAVATSERPVDDAIVRACEREGVAVFRGPAEDVAARAVACAEVHGFGAFVRLCGDSPFYDGVLAGETAAMHARTNADVSTNVFPRSFPPGVSVEVVKTDALRRVLALTAEPADREHVTRYFYRHPGDFHIESIAAPDGRYDGVELTVDTPRDLECADWIMSRLVERRVEPTLDRVASLARQWRREAERADARALAAWEGAR